MKKKLFLGLLFVGASVQCAQSHDLNPHGLHEFYLQGLTEQQLKDINALETKEAAKGLAESYQNTNRKEQKKALAEQQKADKIYNNKLITLISKALTLIERKDGDEIADKLEEEVNKERGEKGFDKFSLEESKLFLPHLSLHLASQLPEDKQQEIRAKHDLHSMPEEQRHKTWIQEAINYFENL